LSQISEKSLEDIRKDPNLFQFALAGGESAYKVNCVQCHGTGAQGGGIYPNLNDDDWLWGGSLENIHQTLKHGIRFANDDDTRTSEMPAFGRDELLEPAQISDVAEFVLKLSNQEHDSAAAGRGQEVYTENCAACHGETGLGDPEQGAPNLADAIWFYGGSKDELVAQISAPKQGVMPAWQGRLNDVTLKQLTLYVHSLGGGE
jgi:cytochrome c oxidase cbb3-type subunit 3